MDCAELVVGDVGVDLGGGNVGVAEHDLDGTDIGTVTEEISGKTVTNHVRGHLLGNTSFSRIIFNNSLDAARS